MEVAKSLDGVLQRESYGLLNAVVGCVDLGVGHGVFIEHTAIAGYQFRELLGGAVRFACIDCMGVAREEYRKCRLVKPA